ncbi:MAG: hypothetical protein JJLCMIEE_00734 [Acidimicrobiales bacterium]|nr:MAG: hypothetical protein EDR02_02685 [Actinomycetota bacterium]MBV6507679.1 hypothetical protein [Acidimicrobiales bacterium]RIK07608.1 MAG: hypothetical protein DCC48_03695 [Acidobacteriota bacterium]
MRRIALVTFAVAALALLSSACGLVPVPAPPPPDTTTTTTEPATGPVAEQVDDTHWWVTNPGTGARLWVTVVAPAETTDSPLPGVVMVPGGSADSSGLIRDAQTIAAGGYLVVLFDPDGRGQSEGVEDYNGADQQAGLAEVVRFAATLPAVDPDRLAIATNSYGITMGAGALASYDDLGVDLLIDWEGPADRTDTGGCNGQGPVGHISHDCSDESWWAEREAATFIGAVDVAYVRLQSATDHVQPDAEHALRMINAALNGNAALVVLNTTVIDEPLEAIDPALLVPDSADRYRASLVVASLDTYLD